MELKPDFYYSYYIYAGGMKSAVETIRFVLDAPVDGEKLRDAAAALIKRIPWLALKPYVTADGKLRARYEDSGLPVYQGDGSGLSVGSSDTEGYLFCVSFRENMLYLTIGHSLSDGRGMVLIGQTLLAYYLKRVYGKADCEGMIPEEGDAPSETELLTLDHHMGQSASSAELAKRPEKVIDIPGEREYLTGRKSRIARFSCDTAELKKLVRSLDTTPAVFSAVTAFEAVHEAAPGAEGNAGAILPVDLRNMFGSRAVMNFCGSMQLDDLQLDGLPFEKKLAKLRETVEYRKGKEYQIAAYNSVASFAGLFEMADLNDAAAFDAQRQKNSFAGRGRSSLLLTNVGKLYFPADIAAHVEKYDMFPVNTDYFPMLWMDSEKDKSRFVLVQSSEDRSFEHAFRKLLAGHGLETGEPECFYSTAGVMDVHRFERI